MRIRWIRMFCLELRSCMLCYVVPFLVCVRIMIFYHGYCPLVFSPLRRVACLPAVQCTKRVLECKTSSYCCQREYSVSRQGFSPLQSWAAELTALTCCLHP